MIKNINFSRVFDLLVLVFAFFVTMEIILGGYSRPEEVKTLLLFLIFVEAKGINISNE